MLTETGERLCKLASWSDYTEEGLGRAFQSAGKAFRGVGNVLYHGGVKPVMALGRLGGKAGLLAAKGIDAFGRFAVKKPKTALALTALSFGAAKTVPDEVERHINNVNPDNPYIHRWG